jgi:hypothetical protein
MSVDDLAMSRVRIDADALRFSLDLGLSIR